MTGSASEPGAASVVWTLDDVLPQKPPMVLLDAIVAHDADSTTCSVRIDSASFFASTDGSVPSWVALEFMAQCAAAHSGICERDKGNPIRLGFLLGRLAEELTGVHGQLLALREGRGVEVAEVRDAAILFK